METMMAAFENTQIAGSSPDSIGLRINSKKV